MPNTQVDVTLRFYEAEAVTIAGWKCRATGIGWTECTMQVEATPAPVPAPEGASGLLLGALVLAGLARWSRHRTD